VHASGELGSNPVRFGESNSAGSSDVVVGAMTWALAVAGVRATTAATTRAPVRRADLPPKMTMDARLPSPAKSATRIGEWSPPTGERPDERRRRA
jgi:hypothetical protein